MRRASMTLQSDGSLVIHHPQGGMMTVSQDGTVEANGFVGKACDVARVISDAIGSRQDRTDKPEYLENSQSVEY